MTVARIQTYSGLMVDPLHLSIQDIRLEDIAHALSNLCRFTGHVKRFYSVAEHSVRCSWLVDSVLAPFALLHDASEAYLQDISRPLKQTEAFRVYREAEGEAQRTIRKALLSHVRHPDWVSPVHDVDETMLHYEARHLMDAEWANPHRVAAVGPYGCIDPIDLGWSPAYAKRVFLDRARELGIGA